MLKTTFTVSMNNGMNYVPAKDVQYGAYIVIPKIK